MAGDPPNPKPPEKSRTNTQPSLRTRQNISAGSARVDVESILADPTQAVKDVLTAKSYLTKTEYIPAGVEVNTAELVKTLVTLSVDKSVNKQTCSVIRAVVFLLQSRDLAAHTLSIVNAVSKRIETYLQSTLAEGPMIPKIASEIEKNLTSVIEKRLDEALESIQKHVKEAIDSFPPPPQPMAPVTNYRDALTQNGTRNPNNSLDSDPKQRARQLSKARQLLIDFTDSTEKEKMRNTSLTTLIEDANKALKKAVPEAATSVINAAKLPHGGLLLEFSSQDSVRQLDPPAAKEAFLRELGTTALVRPRQYNVVVYFVPITFNMEDADVKREVEENNRLTAHSLSATRWIKPLNRRSPRQSVAHAIFTFTDPQNANKALVEGLMISQKYLNTAKSKREPIRCMKCQKWGHLANACPAESDVCGTCGSGHRTNLCPSTDRFCTPCGIDGHPSWDRDCPTFSSKCAEMDSRTPENLLTYFPTDEPWTQRTHQSPWSLPAPAQQAWTVQPPSQPPSRPLALRITPTQPAATRRAPRDRTDRPHTDNGPVPTIDEPYPDPTIQLEDSRSARRDAPPAARRNNHPDTHVRASGRGKPGRHIPSQPRLMQTTLEAFRYRPASQATTTSQPTPLPTTTATATATTAAATDNTDATATQPILLTQDFNSLLEESANRFAPIAPPDLDDEEDPLTNNHPTETSSEHTQTRSPSVTTTSPSSSPPVRRSPIPTIPRSFPMPSPLALGNWSNYAPDKKTDNAEDSDCNVSVSSNV